MCLLVPFLSPQFFSFLIGLVCNSVILVSTKPVQIVGNKKDTLLIILLNQKVQYELQS